MRVPYGDIAALEAAITPSTVAVLLEPIQGEAGVIVPPAGYLPAVRELTTREQVLFIADEIQSGLGRTGATFACDHEGVVPDIYLLGKALGGGIVPVSAVVADARRARRAHARPARLDLRRQPARCAVGLEVVRMLADRRLAGARPRAGRATCTRVSTSSSATGSPRCAGVGLWAGIDIDPAVGTARDVCMRLLERGILAKDTHGQTVRLAPPIVIDEADLDMLVREFRSAVGA